MNKENTFIKLLKFALPLVIGSIFQLTYNLFDYIVLGWFSSEPINSQASLGIASPIFNIFISLISGLCVGFAIHSSILYGKNDLLALRKQFTSFALAFAIVIILLTFLFNLLLNPIMSLSNANDSILRHQAMLYLGITSIGFIFSFIYNLYASFLRAMSDSISSLIFLVFSCLLNIGLNILFVIVFDLEIIGVALSTLISMFISALLILLYGKIRYKNILVFKIKDYVIDKNLLKVSSKYALASAFQQIVLFVGKYLVSIKVNAFDACYIAAYSSATKIDDFVFAPTQNFAHASSILMAQSKGSNNKDKFKKYFFTGFLLNIIYGVLISIIIFIFKKYLLNLFITSDVKDKELVIKYGLIYLSYMCMFYMCPALTNSIQSFFRGLGKLNIVFYSTSVQILARVLSIFILCVISKNIMQNCALACLFGWIIMLLFECPILLYHYTSLDKHLKKV